MGQLKGFFGDASLLTMIKRKFGVVCSTRNIIGMVVSGNGQQCLCLLKHAGNAQNIGQIKAEVRRNKKWGCLVEKEEICVLLLFIL